MCHVYIIIVCNQGDIRLQGGANNRTGRVEICNDQQWGTVCDDAWGVADANVACRQLGFSPTGMYNRSFLPFKGVIVMKIICNRLCCSVFWFY